MTLSQTRLASRTMSMFIAVWASILCMQCSKANDDSPAKSTTQPDHATQPAGATQPTVATRPVAFRKRAMPPASHEYAEERNRMVDKQIIQHWDLRVPVKDKEVLRTMRTVPRHAFVPRNVSRLAYADTPLPIGHGQTISQPYIVAFMTELLRLGPNAKVLEIGTGSGYQAAVLAHLTPQVYTIEIIQALSDRAKETLRAQGYHEVQCRHTDGYFGWPEHAPFDAIIVTCAAGHLPPPLWDQLKPGGRIVIPMGSPYANQRLVVVTKTETGQRISESVLSVRFVPLTRQKNRR